MLFYTVCHINQLAEACVLGDSLKAQSPDYQFVIGLADNKSTLSKLDNLPYQIVDITEIGIPNFTEFCAKYTCDEVLRNSKPFFAEYFLKQFSEMNNLIYFDANSLIFNKLDFIFDSLKINNIIIVPQLTHAGKHPDEKQILNTGIYHNGFFALKRSDETTKFLKWWQDRVAKKGFVNLCKGMNADQLWFEHVPVFFEKVHIEKHEGLNVGYWNLAERKVQVMDGGNQWLSNLSPLISYNFTKLDYWSLYSQQLKKYEHQIQKLQPAYGIYSKPRKPNFVSKSLRKLAESVDGLIDIIS